MGKLITTSEVITRSKNRFGNDRFTYENTVYVNSKQKLKFNCNIHGEFETRIGDHLKYESGGCKKCAKALVSVKNGFDSNTFIIRAETKHNHKYDYSKVNYRNNHTLVTIICPEHGEFKQRPMNHLRGQGCPKCTNNARYTTSDFIERSMLAHGSKYDYSKVTEILNCKKPVTIICPEHGEFEQSPTVHAQVGCGCPSCATWGYDSSGNGFVYVLSNGESMKIGITNNLKNRLSKLKRATPFNFELVTSVKIDAKLALTTESFSHMCCESMNYSGFDGATEWFRHDDSVINMINKIGAENEA